MLTQRMQQIVEAMLTNGENIISVKQLAEIVGVSKRTIQRELEYIGSSLKPYHVTFESKTGVGVWMEGTEEDKERLLLEISSKEHYDATNREERRKRLTLEILKEKGLKKLFVYSSKFKVSEATISADLEIVEKWLRQYELHVVRKPGSGIYVDGSEQNYRKAIRAFIHENMNTKLMWESYQPPFEMSSSYEVMKKSGMGQMLEEDVMQQVVNCITQIQNVHILTLTENSYMGLVLHISIAIHRILQEEVIDADDKWLEKFEEDEDYELAEDIVWALEETFDIEIPEMEVSYICLHIKGAKHEGIQFHSHKILEIDNQEIKQLLNEMIDAFDSKKAYILRQDEEFIQGLLAHLQPTLVRLHYGLEIHNPILEGIQSDYQEIYEKCKIVAEVIEASRGIQVPEAEIGFLTVHFGAALVRAEGRLEHLRPVKVAVVCSSGIGISRLMSSKLEKVFQDRMIIKTYGKREMTPYEEQKYDFCISSIHMENLGIPFIEVNPLLNEEDIGQVRSLVTKYERMPSKDKKSLEVEDQMEEVHLVANQIKHIIKYMECHFVDSTISFEALLENIGYQLSLYEEQQKMITKSIMEREKLATQVYAEFEFALLHARTEGVTNPAFHIWLTEGLGRFEEPYFKGISIAFVMLMPVDEYQKIYSEILGHISGMLIEDVHFLRVVKAGQQEEIRDELSRMLKKFFSAYLMRFTENTF